jgi:hypothetical protein
MGLYLWISVNVRKSKRDTLGPLSLVTSKWPWFKENGAMKSCHHLATLESMQKNMQLRNNSANRNVFYSKFKTEDLNLSNNNK